MKEHMPLEARYPKKRSKAYLNVEKSVKRQDENLKKFPKVARGLAKVGRTLGAVVSPFDAEELAYRISRKLTRKRKGRMSDTGTYRK